MKGFSTAWRLLTQISIFGGELEQPHKSMIWFPLVGLILGLLSYGLLGVLSPIFTSQITALFLIVFSVWVTRGLHLDGLADLADGVYSGKNRPGMLEVMKDPRLGTFGVVSLVLILLVKWQLLALVLGFERGFVLLGLVGLFSLSRFGQGWMAARFDYARAAGTGKGFIGGATNKDGLKMCLVVVGMSYYFHSQFLFLALAVILFVEFFGRSLTNRLGGVTGDCLGATSELSEVLVLLAVIILQHLQFVGSPIFALIWN
ncbi:MAG: adenosylcobinamide-GDP ribazoletransferase [SAR324 cluster bacterium]|nr:adenosylcobinamide-GDP ribazoletransferase [SAR324 cluster bacterium]